VAIAGSDPDDSLLAPIAGPQAASSSSSQAGVPVFIEEVEARIPFVLGELFVRRAHEEPVRFQDFPYMDYSIIDALAERGVIRVYTDDFGDSMISLNVGRLRQCSNMVVTSPQQALRTQLPGQALSQPKLYHMIRLREQGWIPGDPTEAFVPIGPQVYRETLARPTSYFVCLLDHEAVFAKAVVEIQHDQSSNYYKCLLGLGQDKLLQMCLHQDGKDDAWFRRQLVGREPDSGSDGSGSDEGGGARRRGQRHMPISADDALGVLAPVLRTQVPWWETEWRRCWVSLDGHRHKVWFDNQSAPSGVRRGWANCAVHGCGCIRPVRESRDWFATALSLWRAHGHGRPGMPRQEHLGWWPDDAAVAAAVTRATFENV